MAESSSSIKIQVEVDHPALRESITELLKDFVVWYDDADTEDLTLDEIVEDFFAEEVDE